MVQNFSISVFIVSRVSQKGASACWLSNSGRTFDLSSELEVASLAATAIVEQAVAPSLNCYCLNVPGSFLCDLSGMIVEVIFSLDRGCKDNYR